MDAGGLGAPPAETAKPHTGGAAARPKGGRAGRFNL